MARQLSILNIGGHPKDAIMYAGGTLAKHAGNGDPKPNECEVEHAKGDANFLPAKVGDNDVWGCSD